MLAVSAAALAAAYATNLCLPNVHSAFITAFSDRTVDQHHGQPQEYKDAENTRIFVDVNQQKTLQYIHDEDPQARNSPNRGILRDYSQGQQWSWDWDQKDHKVVNCQVQKMPEGKLQPFCISTNATFGGSGTIGEHSRVDFYNEQVNDRQRGVQATIVTVVESGGTSNPVQQRSRGVQRDPQRGDVQFYEQYEWFNFTTTALPANTFTVPPECPKALGAPLGTNLCLPKVHETHLSQYTDRVVQQGNRPQEYQQGDFLHLWIDQNAKQTLVHIHPIDPQTGNQEPEQGVLTNYNSGMQYRWVFGPNHSIQKCQASKVNGTMSNFCISQNATLVGSGTISKDFEVDFYNEQFNDPQHRAQADIQTIMEQGSTSVPVQERRFGQYMDPQHGPTRFYEQLEWYNFTEGAIPSSVFAVPTACGKL